MCNHFSTREKQFFGYLKPCAFFHKFGEGLKKPGLQKHKP